MNAQFFVLAFVAALNPKYLAVDLLLIENRRPRAMFLCILIGGMTVALTIGLLDVLTIHADAINSQKTASAGVDLVLGLALVATGARRRSRPAAGSRQRRRRTAGRSGCWLSPGSGSPCSSARCAASPAAPT
jgi:hypothetical protein